MVKLSVVARDGAGTSIEAELGFSVMESVRNAGFDEMLALCGGFCGCATCHVYVDEQWLDRLPPIGEDESDLLEGSGNMQPNSRLACQLIVEESLDGLQVVIAPEE